MRRPLGSWRHPAWLLLRAVLGLSAVMIAFVDGLGTFLSPGQALAAAFHTVSPGAADPRWGVIVGLSLYAGLAFLSVAVRAWDPAERRHR